MSPWELVAFYIVVPIVGIGVWLHNRYETEGADVPEFEAWVRRERPVLFALRCREGAADELAEAARRLVGVRGEVVNHRGRFPWTRHVLSLGIEVDERRGLVRGRIGSARIRRVRDERPEVGRLVDDLAATFGDRLDAVWLQAELARGDAEPNGDRIERGWEAPIERGKTGSFSRTRGLPSWAEVTPPPGR